MKNITTLTSPNHDDRRGQSVDMLVLHYTGMRTGAEAIARLVDPAAKVSAHYVVEEDGRIFQLVPEDRRAWHAGVSSWRGRADVNTHSIGIEIVNPGHEYGYRPFPSAQMFALKNLCQGIVSRHAIPKRNVVAHSDIAPTRKEDPGELFDWKGLAAEGIGIWPNLNAADSEADWEALLEYGYPIESADPASVRAAIIAFQRHFRPANLSGEWDEECSKVLSALLEQSEKR